MRTFISASICLVVATALAACGGGGDSPAGGTDGGAIAVSGLVMAAPVPGAVLHTQAETLRPAIDGAIWRFRGQTQSSPTATPQDFTETVTHSAPTASGITETSVDTVAGGSSDVTTVTRSGGTVSQVVRLDVTGKGLPGEVTLVELRSPVRSNELIVMVDRHYTDTTIDVDGDRVTDALDFAMFALVVGPERVTLPNRPALQAVRVDLFLRGRVVPSSTNVPGPVTESRLQTWYVPGIGIVRQASQMPNANATGTETRDQWLDSLDAGTAGFGALPSTALVVPAGNGVYPGRDVPGMELQAYTLADRVLLVSRMSAFFNDSLVTRLDLRGQVVEARLLPGLGIGPQTIAAGGAAGVNFLEPLGTGWVADYGLTRIDSDGRLMGTARGTTLNLSGGLPIAAADNVRMAIDGSTMWLLFNRSYRLLPAPFTSHLVLRACDLDGNPLAPDQIVDTASGSGIDLAADQGQVFLIWQRLDSSKAVMVARASLTGALEVRTLASPLVGTNSFMTPLRLAGRNAVLWSAQLGSGQSLGAAGGLLFNDSLTAVPAGTTLLDEQISGFAPFDSSQPGATARAGHIVVSTSTTGTLWPGDTSSRLIDVVSWMDPDTQALARTPTSTIRLPSVEARWQAVYADRVILIGGGTPVRTAVVWLQN